MLLTLRLTDFGVLEEAEVTFGPGLTVLTGETGAGKSMLLGALGLLLGGRAEADVVRAGADEAVVEGILERDETLMQRLEDLGLPDLGPEIVIRRVVAKTGRARVHVNGALTAVGVLARLKGAAAEVEDALSTRESSASELVGVCIGQLEEAERHDPSLAPLREKLHAVQNELDEAVRAVSRWGAALESDPGRLGEVEDRLE